MHVFVDPFQEADEALAKERAEEIAKKQLEIEEKQRKKDKQPLKVYRDGVGKYLCTVAEPSTSTALSKNEPEIKKKKKGNYNFGDFSSW